MPVMPRELVVPDITVSNNLKPYLFGQTSKLKERIDIWLNFQ